MHRSLRSSPLALSVLFSLALVTNTARAQIPPPPDAPVAQPPAEPPPPNVPPSPPSPPPAPPMPGPEMPPYVAPPPPTNPLVVPPLPPPVSVMPPGQAPVAPAPVKLAPPKVQFPTRSWRLGPSMQVMLFEPFPYQKVSRIGTGLFGAYEFFLKPSFVIGINLSYRFYPGEARLHQVGYGLLLKHYLAGMDSLDSTFMPYVEYGLLLQINKLSGRPGTGTAHDTRLSAGTDLRIAKKIFFIEASYHYSRLGLFEQPSERLDNIEIDVGYRYPW